MRILSYISCFVALLIAGYGCVNNKQTSIVMDNAESSSLKSANIVGVYRGDLPCVDCDAIRTVLELNRDHSYKLIYSYEGKSDDSFVKSGDWVVKKDKLVLDGVDYFYKIANESLVQLDLSGEEITGDLAESYQLLKVK